jgi:hypothetical protein
VVLTATEGALPAPCNIDREIRTASVADAAPGRSRGMSTRAHETAGREWAYHLRQLSADLDAQGQPARARELARLAEATEPPSSGGQAVASKRPGARGNRSIAVLPGVEAR